MKFPKGTGAVFHPEAVEEFLREETLNSMQAEAFDHAVGQPGAELGARLSIVQGPPGTGKANLFHVIMRYFLQQNIKVLFIAASNKAVDVASNRLLQQVQKNNKLTHGIYRIRVDALERITADPDIRDREEHDEWTEGSRVVEIENEGSPRSPSLINIDPTDIAIQASVE